MNFQQHKNNGPFLKRSNIDGRINTWQLNNNDYKYLIHDT
jgi:hypothetical protein